MQEFHSPKNYLKSALNSFKAKRIISEKNNEISDFHEIDSYNN